MIAVIKSTILIGIRSRKNFVFMILFPLFLILVIGGTTASSFDKINNSVAIEELVIYYVDESNNKTSEVFNTFSDIVKESKDIDKIELRKINNIEEGKKEVRVNREILLHLKDNNIEMYSNDNSSIRSSIIYQILESVADRYNAITEVYTINSLKAKEIIGYDIEDFIEVNNISYEKSPSSMDYYGVAEIGLMLFYFVNYPLFTLSENKRSNIKDRVKISGLSTAKYYLLSFIGFFIFSFGASLVTYILSNILFNINYGDNVLIVPLAMIPFLILVNGLGTIIPIIFESDKTSRVILQNVVIPVLCFLGGGYIALYGEMDGIFNILTKISPLRWFNSSVFRYIYSDDKSLLINWFIFGIISLILIVIMIYLITRKEDRVNEKYISIN